MHGPSTYAGSLRYTNDPSSSSRCIDCREDNAYLGAKKTASYDIDYPPLRYSRFKSHGTSVSIEIVYDYIIDSFTAECLQMISQFIIIIIIIMFFFFFFFFTRSDN